MISVKRSMKPPNSFASDDIDEIIQQVYKYINTHISNEDTFDGAVKIITQSNESQFGISNRVNAEFFRVSFSRGYNPYIQIAVIISEIQSDTELLYKISLINR
jgi:hypothetical protein